MNAIEDAIQLAVEKGGYDAVVTTHDGIGRPVLRRKNSEYLSHDSMFLDPLFWQAYGKAAGLKKEVLWNDGHVRHPAQWRSYWHRLIDHLAQGGAAESFFAELMK